MPWSTLCATHRHSMLDMIHVFPLFLLEPGVSTGSIVAAISLLLELFLNLAVGKLTRKGFHTCSSILNIDTLMQMTSFRGGVFLLPPLYDIWVILLEPMLLSQYFLSARLIALLKVGPSFRIPFPLEFFLLGLYASADGFRCSHSHFEHVVRRPYLQVTCSGKNTFVAGFSNPHPGQRNVGGAVFLGASFALAYLSVLMRREQGMQ